MRRLRLALLVLPVIFLAGASVAWAIGELTQKPLKPGCISDSGTGGACEDGDAIGSVNGVAVSPDGKNVYSAGFSSDSLAVFDRDPTTGAIEQKDAAAGCFTQA